MTKTKAVILACGTLLLGIVIGGLLVGFVFHSYVKLSVSGMEARAYTQAAQSVRLLERLRQGETQSAIESLEVQLDGGLIQLWGFYKDMPADKRDPRVLKLLARIREYRAKHPRKTEHPEFDQSIAEVLAWAR